MAFFDDPEWLLRHIRHCSVVADDTGMYLTVVTWEGRYPTSNQFWVEEWVIFHLHFRIIGPIFVGSAFLQ